MSETLSLFQARGHASSHTCVSLECCKEKCLFSANVCMAPTDTKTSVATPVIPFCQYPDDEECYREGAPPTNEPTLVPLGNTVTRIYVVSAVQVGVIIKVSLYQSHFDTPLLTLEIVGRGNQGMRQGGFKTTELLQKRSERNHGSHEASECLLDSNQ